MGKYNEALKKYFSAIEFFDQSNNRKLKANTYNNIGDLYMKLNDLDQAEYYLNKGLSIGLEMENLRTMHNSYAYLTELFEQKRDYKQALEFYKRMVEEERSISNEENTKKMLQSEMSYQFNKQMLEDSLAYAAEAEIKNIKLEEQKKRIEQKRIVQYFLYGGLFLVLVFAGTMYNRFRVTRRQKNIIQEQKHLVEIKQQEILDSINYARRIQKAILPPNNLINEYIPNSFILYKPKDIVAGDFYWLEKYGSTTFVAAADCTGHGVPGAMVSVVCNNGLNRSVREYKITSPAKILDKTKEIVVQEFEKSDDKVNDGMDIALLSIDELGAEDKYLVKYAGANNPLWYIKGDTKELHVIKADKQPIGKCENSKSYTEHELNLSKGDTMYIFSDGYVDQFGGEKGKKLKSVNFKKLILEISAHSMSEQRHHLDEFFEDWRKNHEQLDDVCIIGVRI